MAKGNSPVEVRLDEETKARWRAAATDAGYKSLSEFIRAHVENGLAAGGLVAPPKPTDAAPVRPVDSRNSMGDRSRGGVKRSYEPDFKPDKAPKGGRR